MSPGRHKKTGGTLMNNFAGAARVTIIGVAGFLCLTQNALGAGFALREGSADWEGNAFAGDTAKAYDASTVYANPAGMVRLNWNELDASVNVIAPNVRF